MTISKAWRELYRARLSELPLDCGNIDDPGVIYSEDLRDWSNKATTPDQARMELYIDRYDLTNKRILHIGIGNSGLAKRFHSHTKEIVGTTIDKPEIDAAAALSVPNYQVVLHNKFSGQDESVPGKFDFILDNNPTSPCCCIRHLAALFDFYVAKLAERGQFVTDLEGLRWLPDRANPRWSFDFEDLAAVASAAGLFAFKANKKVFVLSRTLPPRPGYSALFRHLLRRATAFPGKLVRKATGVFRHASHKSLEWLLISKVPRALPARYGRKHSRPNGAGPSKL